MAGNTFGTLFRVTTAGESHGAGNLVILDGVPAGLELGIDDLLPDLMRRRPGQSDLVTQRQEEDLPEILSGVFRGQTTGSSLAVLVRNNDSRSRDYDSIRDSYRPGHADFSTQQKYGLRDYRGGGRASARETVSRVVAGAVARKLLASTGIRVQAWVDCVGDVCIPEQESLEWSLAEIESNPVRCPHPESAAAMSALIRQCREDQDSIGGSARIVARGLPAGLGEPVFDKLRADLGKALFSLPAVMGVEFGAGFAVCASRGSQNNDLFTHDDKRGIHTKSNRHGGMLGGISTGMPLTIRCAVKPASSLAQPQKSVREDGSQTVLRTEGRHDPCLLPRFIPMAEAMVLITLADHWLRQRCARL